MKRNLIIGISLAVAAILLLAFFMWGGKEEEPVPTPEASEIIQPTPAPTATPEPTPTPTPTPHDMSWDEAHSLDTQWRPAGANGLELPVRGATGFTSVRLGLYANQPSHTMPIPTPTPVPPAVSTPVPTASAAPQPDSTPVPTASAAPQPDSTAVREPVAPAPAELSASPEQPMAAAVTDAEASEEPAETETPAPAESAAPAESVGPVETAPVITSVPAASTAPETQLPETQPPATESDAAATAVPAPSPAPTPTAVPSPTPVPTPAPDPFEGAFVVLEPGTPFLILQESGPWWLVSTGWGTGWVEHRYCMINLPDVIPSMIFDATNSYQSMYICCGKEIPGVTGGAFYPGKQPNQRLGQDQFVMPMLYASAKKLNQAQQSALAQGNTLLLREAYRPNSTQLAVVNGMNTLIRQDPEVKRAITAPPWSLTWFINTSISNHQRGFAVDITMAKAFETERRTTGELEYLVVTDYEEYEMTSRFHELSPWSATFTGPVPSHSKTAWRSAKLASAMNAPALGLQRYFTQAGFTPLASEWWHFNDLDTRLSVLHNLCGGGFLADTCLSTAP